MAAKTLNTVALKTVLAGNVKLPATADRIGAGFAVVIDTYPTTFLSQGQFPLPQLPEPEPRSRRAVVEMSMPPAAGPAGPAGSPSGVSASRRPRSLGGSALTGDPLNPNRPTPPARTAATATTVAALWPTGTASRAGHPGSLGRWYHVGRDCQSPDGYDGRTDRDAKPRAGWHRTAAPTSAAAK